MAVTEDTVVNENVLCRAADTTAVLVLAGLDGDAVVVDIDVHVTDLDAIAGINIDTVAAGNIVLGMDIQVLDRDVARV